MQVTSSPTLSYHRSSRAEGSPKASSPKASLSGQLRARSLSHPVVDVNAPMAKEPRRLNVDVDSSNPLAKKGAFTLVAESSPRSSLTDSFSNRLASSLERLQRSDALGTPVRTARRFPHDDTGEGLGLGLEGLGLGRSDGALPVLARHATVPAVSFAVSTAPVYGQSSRRARSASYSSNNDKRARSASYSSNNDNSPVLSTSAHPSFYKPELGSNNSQFSSTSSLPDAVPPRAGTDNNNTPGDSRQGSISEELGGMPKFGQHSRQDSKNSMSAENASVVVEFSGESPDHSAADSTEHTEQRTEAPAIQDSLEAQLITKILLREGNSSSPAQSVGTSDSERSFGSRSGSNSDVLDQHGDIRPSSRNSNHHHDHHHSGADHKNGDDSNKGGDNSHGDHNNNNNNNNNSGGKSGDNNNNGDNNNGRSNSQ
eukprot:g2729.t1